MQIKHFKYLFSCFLWLIVSLVSAQGVDVLKAEKDALLKEIEDSKRTLKLKQTTKESTLQQIQLVGQEVAVREDILNSLEAQIRELDRSIDANQTKINVLENDIAVLKGDYSKLLQDTYLRRNSLNELAFFMSAADFSEAYRRYRLLKEYSIYRQKQGQILSESQNRLIALQNDIKLQKEAKESNLAEVEAEISNLSLSRQEKAKLVASLQNEESWLLKLIRDKENEAKGLEQKILEYIRSSSVSALGNDFSSFEGKLLWPVRKGFVISNFGEHEHPVLKNVTIKNNGIDIQSTLGDQVFAVHNGEVSRVVGIPGYNTTVLVRHGKYLTVYANLREVDVKQGQKIYAGDSVGRIFKEESGGSVVLHFEIWHENQKLDPSKWLSP
ncbi:MAG TPA: sugar tyrosine-protein kinase [Marinilabiliaceae bacterium]|jgi:septal ring factor EnvC (AmiA/AmiB activator)|nr:sugar tyrosine-protein kinase [Marinilabiliaceae bacterium]